MYFPLEIMQSKIIDISLVAHYVVELTVVDVTQDADGA
jgi:hypothetical protein